MALSVFRVVDVADLVGVLRADKRGCNASAIAGIPEVDTVGVVSVAEEFIE